MELDIVKNFINHDVEVLVAGVWIEGHMTPIVKGLVTLLPFPDASEFYGPTAMKADVIQAIRQVKRVTKYISEPTPEVKPDFISSSLEQVLPKQRFSKK